MVVYHSFHKNISSKTANIFNLENNKNCNNKDQMSILDWFLKDHITLKTRVMMLKIQRCKTEIDYILNILK